MTDVTSENGTPVATPIEGTVAGDGPRCYRHDVPSFHGMTPGGPGLPAHTWDIRPLPGETLKGCLRCGGQFEVGDRYLCDEGGIIHVTCPIPAMETRA